MNWGLSRDLTPNFLMSLKRHLVTHPLIHLHTDSLSHSPALMGGVLGALVCIYCKSGCSGTAVASALAFHPPIAYYDVVKDDNDG